MTYYQILTSDGVPFGLGIPISNPIHHFIEDCHVLLQTFYFFPPDKNPNFIKRWIDFTFMTGKFYHLCFTTFYPPLVQGPNSEYLLCDFYPESCFNPTLFDVPVSDRIVYVRRWASDNLLEFIKDNSELDGKTVNYVEFVNRSKALSGVQKLLDESIKKLRKTIPDSVISSSMQELNDIMDESQKNKYAINFIQLERQIKELTNGEQIPNTNGEPNKAQVNNTEALESKDQSKDQV